MDKNISPGGPRVDPCRAFQNDNDPEHTDSVDASDILKVFESNPEQALGYSRVAYDVLKRNDCWEANPKAPSYKDVADFQ